MSVVPVSNSSKTKIIADAVWATGGPESECLGAVKNHIDARHQRFPWTKHWHAEIQGTKAALCRSAENETSKVHCLRVFSGKNDDISHSSTADANLKIEDIARAGEFVEVVGGEIDQAHQILSHLANLDHTALDRLETGLSLYSEILKAVAGNAETAGQVLEVFGRHFLDEGASGRARKSEAA